MSTYTLRANDVTCLCYIAGIFHWVFVAMKGDLNVFFSGPAFKDASIHRRLVGEQRERRRACSRLVSQQVAALGGKVVGGDVDEAGLEETITGIRAAGAQVQQRNAFSGLADRCFD